MTVAEDNDPNTNAQPSQASDTEPATPPAAPEPEPQRETLVDAIADLLQMFSDWVRAEAADIARDKFVLPMQQLGLTLASATAAGCLVVVGLHFIFVAVLLILAEWLGWPGALLLVGGVILAGAGVFTYIKMRSIQR